MNNITAVIIAGGKGTRLSSFTKEIPKPMIPINGKSILERQIEEFRNYGITNIIITVGYLKDVIMNYFGDGKKFQVNIDYVEENEPLGSAGAFYYLKDKIKGAFFAVYGDVLFSVSLPKMLKYHQSKNAAISLFVHPNSHPHDSDVVLCNENDMIIDFLRKNADRQGLYYDNLVNAGLFVFEKETLDYFSRPEKKDLEKDFIMSFVRQNKVVAYKSSEYIKDMGTYSRLSSVESHVESDIVRMRNLDKPQKAIFLDRDGTINQHKGLITDPNMLELEVGAAEAIKKINDSGYLAIVITNQPVIARGICTFEELHKIHQKLDMILGEQGAYIDGLYFCPHHPDSGYEGERKEYKIKCQCRKPGIQLIEKAVEDFHIDLSQSYFIGDSTMDIQAGKNAGVKSIVLKTGEAGKDGKYQVTPDFVCENLLSAINLILEGK